MKPLKLAEIQRQFKELIKNSHGEGADFLLPEAEMPARLRIYREDVIWRLMDSLETDFRGLLEVIGREEFLNLARKYVAETPSHSWTLAEFSSAFPEFISHETQNEVWTDLARLDWLKVKVGLGPFPQSFDLQQLQEVSAKAWPQAHFILSPSLQFLNTKTELAVFRGHGGVKTLLLRPSEAKLLREILQGKNLEELAAALGEEKMDLSQVTALIATWVQEGLIEKVIFPAAKMS